MISRATACCAVVLSTCGLIPSQSFVNFENPQTHPIAVSADGSRLYAVNTPDNRLQVSSLLRPDKPALLAEIPVGIGPVSVVPRTADEVWVVNRVSDSISVVSISQQTVTATIRVKDEPADLVFAGSPEVALVSISGSEELRVFDVQTHAELAAIEIFGDEPRALARSGDGNTVWLAVQRSGNQTTVIPEDQAPLPPAPTNPALPAAPQQSLIVDSTDPLWTSTHGLNLPDYDVFEIDVATRAIQRRYSGVGTTLFNIAVHPTTGDLWVANNEALNLVRFEPNLRGHFVDHRLTRFTPGTSPQMAFFDLNPGINYALLPNPAAVASVLAHPTDVVFSADGSTLWVAAFGSDRVAAVDNAGQVTGFVELGAPGATVDPRNKRGPRGLALHPNGQYLYVLNRISMTLAVIDTSTVTLVRERSLGFDPTPDTIADARGFLYDTKLSGNGTASCASCHVDAEIDGIGWDLGDPGGDMKTVVSGGFSNPMHPMKGPMTTQTLRGLTADTKPFHWRGDRADLQAFNPAFDTLLGGQELSSGDMDDYAAFIESLEFPPNPNQNLDRTLPTTGGSTSAQQGFNFFNTRQFAPGLTCVACHTQPKGTNGVIVPGPLLQEPQSFKIPQLRNIYKRQGRTPVGGMSVSGFGLLHDGSVNNVFDLLTKPVFQGLSTQINNKRKLENYMLAFDTGQAPTVGYAVTVTQATAFSPAIANEIGALELAAQAGNNDIIVKGSFRGLPRGFHRTTGGVNYQSDSLALGSFTLNQLLTEIATGNATLTFMGVPVASGRRMAIDRDDDGTLDGDEGLEISGQATPACGPLLGLDGNSMPHIGNGLFAVLADNAPPSSAGAVFLGSQAATTPFADITILVELTTAINLPMSSDTAGIGILELAVPNSPSLVGQSLYTQALFGSTCGQLGVALSNRLKITFGQ